MTRLRRIALGDGNLDMMVLGMGTWRDLIGHVMQRPGEWFTVPCPLSERRRVRASVVTTARRAGIRVTTQWEDRLGGLMWIRERVETAG